MISNSFVKYLVNEIKIKCNIDYKTVRKHLKTITKQSFFKFFNFTCFRKTEKNKFQRKYCDNGNIVYFGLFCDIL